MGISLNPSTLLSGQGIDVASLVNQTLSLQSGQLTEWQNEVTNLQVQQGLLSGLNTDLSSLATAVTALSDPLGAITAQAATSSNTAVLTATAQSGAVAGTNSIVVNNLATVGTVYTKDFAGGAGASILANGATGGEIDLQVGGGTAQPINITAGTNDTLTTLASYINGQNLGVRASVVTDANGSRLALVSQATGTQGALAITSNDTSLSFNPPQGGANASLSINGVPYASSTNTITGAIAGVTLNLTGAAPGSPVQLTVGPDAAQATAAVNSFVSAYNLVISDINSQYTVNSATNSEGPLGSDSSLRELQQSLLSDVTYSTGAASGYTNLASLGISMNDDGTLTVDQTTLSNALSSNPSAFVDFFQNSTQTGFADTFHKDLTNLTDPTEGLLNVDLAQNQAQQQDLNNSITNFQDQLTAEQTQLTQEYSEVNASLQEYPLLLQQTTETLASLDATSSSSSSGSGSPTLTSGL